MLELQKEITDILVNDSTLKSLTGYAANDTRVYAWNPSEDVVYSTSKKGAIFYRFSFGKRPNRWSYPQQFVNASLFTKIVAINHKTVAEISERIIDLFDCQVIETDNWRVGTCELLSYNEVIPEGSPSITQWSKMVSFMMENILKRN